MANEVPANNFESRMREGLKRAGINGPVVFDEVCPNSCWIDKPYDRSESFWVGPDERHGSQGYRVLRYRSDPRFAGNWVLFTTAILLFSFGMLIQYRLYSDPEYNARNKAQAREDKMQALRTRYIMENYDPVKKQMMGLPPTPAQPIDIDVQCGCKDQQRPVCQAADHNKPSRTH